MDKKENENIDDNAEQILTEKFDHNELEKNSTRLLDHDKKVGDGMSLEDIPPEFKKITQIMAMQGFSSSAQSDISTKINERHIDRILEIS